MYFRSLIFLILVGTCFACLDEYNPPEVENSESILVVEGNISDSSSIIRLTQTANISEDRLIEVANARVVLENERGDFSETLQNNEGGIYKTQTLLNTNDKFRIQIQTEGNIYTTEYLAIQPTPPIDSVSWENVDDNFQVQVSTHDDNNDLQYYLWSFEETWLYRARFPSLFIYENDQIIPRSRDEDIFICWSSASSTSIQIGTTVNLEENIVFKQPIHVIEPINNVKLSRRYSILVKQYAISKEAFEFWQLLKKNSESLGTLFDPQPSQLTTNLTCINNPEKPVIGYVMASKEQQKRIFVNRGDLPFKNIPFTPNISCRMDTISLDPEDLRNEFASGTNLITFEIFDDAGGFIGYGSTPPSCADCRIFGGTIEKPDFWIDG